MSFHDFLGFMHSDRFDYMWAQVLQLQLSPAELCYQYNKSYKATHNTRQALGEGKAFLPNNLASCITSLVGT